MIRHIITLIWNQWRSNLWVVAELFVVFIVIWFMADTFLMQAVLIHRPVGFDTEQVYEVKLSMRSKDYPGYIEYEEGSDEPLRNFERMVERIERYPGVEAVAVSSYSLPYTYSMSMNGLWRDTTTRADARMMQVTPGFFKVFDLHGVSGETSEVLAERLGTYDDKRITLSARLARKLFGDCNGYSRPDVVMLALPGGAERSRRSGIFILRRADIPAEGRDHPGLSELCKILPGAWCGVYGGIL